MPFAGVGEANVLKRDLSGGLPHRLRVGLAANVLRRIQDFKDALATRSRLRDQQNHKAQKA